MVYLIANFSFPDFLNGGILEVVMIPEGGGTQLSCEYVDSLGMPREAGWFRDSVQIVNDNYQSQCDCVAASSGFSSTLTFSNYMNERSSGHYGCWAFIPEGFDECNFYVTLPGKSSRPSCMHYHNKPVTIQRS